MNSRLLQLQKKPNKIVAGLMSGTSLDGIDCVLTHLSHCGEKTQIRPIIFRTYSFSTELKKFIMKCSHSGNVQDITQLNILLGKIFANAIIQTSRTAKIPLSGIDCIGSHGQTIQHLPHTKKILGYKIKSTLQIGDPAVIAQETGVVTIGDFRVADMAVGGEGAPLIPYFDYLFFRSRQENRLLLNIGGIANFTVLPKNCTLKNVIAFDTGPGIMVVDTLMQHFYNRPYDKNGKSARTGKIIPDLLTKLIRTPYIHQRPPKSTGREIFGQAFVTKILKWRKANPCRKIDLITTLSEFTVKAIWLNYQKFIHPKMNIDEIILSGGGSHNSYIRERLIDYFPDVRFSSIEKYGISSDEKEALCFAVLANECISEIPANVPSVTGAQKKVILGKICVP